MKEWFTSFLGGFAKVTLTGWVLVAFLLVLAMSLTLMFKRQSKSKMTAFTWTLALIAIVTVLLFAKPDITVEEGANTTASFLYSPVFWALLFGIGGVASLFMLLRKQVFTTRMLSVGALCVSLAFILSFMTLYRLPEGGSITPASMLPIFVFAYLYGPVPGIASGTVYGILQLVQGAYVVHPIQFLLDYILPFAVLGVAGLFRKNKQLPIGVLVGCILRFAIHVASGVVFFASYAPVGQNVLLYSVLYNGSYMLPETLICTVIAFAFSASHAFTRLRQEIIV